MFNKIELASKSLENFRTPAYWGLLFRLSFSKQVLSACWIRLGSYSHLCHLLAQEVSPVSSPGRESCPPLQDEVLLTLFHFIPMPSFEGSAQGIQGSEPG